MAETTQYKIEDVAEYMVALVNEFGKRHTLSDEQAFSYMYRYGAIDDIVSCYGAAHTLSFDDVCQMVENICRRKGGKI